uniref:F-box protein 44 n=1 Tax=Equus caballus TaxID=9796 RepID=A0A3Q2I5Q5_HORSE
MAVGNINELPENILLELFTHVPARQLLLRCRLVCSLWRDLIDLVTLWKRKCLREGFITEDWDQPVADWKIFYFLRSLHRNLLHNPCAEGLPHVLQLPTRRPLHLVSARRRGHSLLGRLVRPEGHQQQHHHQAPTALMSPSSQPPSPNWPGSLWLGGHCKPPPNPWNCHSQDLPTPPDHTPAYSSALSLPPAACGPIKGLPSPTCALWFLGGKASLMGGPALTCRRCNMCGQGIEGVDISGPGAWHV